MPTIINPFVFSSAGPFSIEYLASIEADFGEGNITGSVDIGAVDTSKEIFVLCSITYSSATSLTSKTVSSVAGTSFTTEFDSGGNATQLGFFVAQPTQTGSQTVFMQFNNALGSGVAFVYKVLNRPGIGTQHTDASGTSSVSQQTRTLNATTIATDGIWLCTGIKGNQNPLTWNNGTVDVQVDTLADNRAWGAHRNPAVSGSTPTDTFSWSGFAPVSVASWAFG